MVYLPIIISNDTRNSFRGSTGYRNKKSVEREQATKFTNFLGLKNRRQNTQLGQQGGTGGWKDKE